MARIPVYLLCVENTLQTVLVSVKITMKYRKTLINLALAFLAGKSSSVFVLAKIRETAGGIIYNNPMEKERERERKIKIPVVILKWNY